MRRSIGSSPAPNTGPEEAARQESAGPGGVAGGGLLRGEAADLAMGLEAGRDVGEAPDIGTAACSLAGMTATSIVDHAPIEEGESGSPSGVLKLESLAGPLSALAASIHELLRVMGGGRPGSQSGWDDGADQGSAGATPAEPEPRDAGGYPWTPALASSRGANLPGDAGRDTSSEPAVAGPSFPAGPGAAEFGAVQGGAASSGFSELSEYQRRTEEALASAAEAARRQAQSAESLAALLAELSEADARLQAKIDQLASQVANRR